MTTRECQCDRFLGKEDAKHVMGEGIGSYENDESNDSVAESSMLRDVDRPA